MCLVWRLFTAWCCVLSGLSVVQQVAAGKQLVIRASSETKEYWVPREHVTLGVEDTDTIGYLIDQLCYIFHRSRKMAQHKESYPCQSRSKSLMLYNPDTKAEYRDTEFTLGFYKIANGTRLYLYYS